MDEGAGFLGRMLAIARREGWEAAKEAVGLGQDPGEGPTVTAAKELLAGWSDAERGRYATAIGHFDAVGRVTELIGWSRAGNAFIALRVKDMTRADRLLEEAKTAAGADDDLLRGTIRHLRSALLHHRGEAERAREVILEHLKEAGLDHFAAGRALDTLGMIYAAGDDPHAAREIFRAAIACKERHGDSTGLAISSAQLGRLELDWGALDEAEDHLGRALSLVERLGDGHGRAQTCNHLGQSALARGVREAALGRAAAAREAWAVAADWIDAAIALAGAGGNAITEGYARKDRALVHLEVGEPEAAEVQARRASEIFAGAGFAEGTAHAERVLGALHRARGEWDESASALRASLAHFERSGEIVEVARARLELARTLRASGVPRPLVVRALGEALDAAEASRRDRLVQAIEQELMAVDPAAYRDRAYRRARGRSVVEDTTSLVAVARESATVLYLDLEGSTEYSRGRDPEEVVTTLNRMMADLAAPLRRRAMQVSVYRGDGFLALARGRDHAVRAVTAAMELFKAIARFNEPRALIGLPNLAARVGIASGEVVLGNVGTYDKMDFTAIGTTANLGARLESQALVGLPCISRGTFEMVGDRFAYHPACPRTVELKGLGQHQIWDVVGPSAA